MQLKMLLNYGVYIAIGILCTYIYIQDLRIDSKDATIAELGRELFVEKKRAEVKVLEVLFEDIINEEVIYEEVNTSIGKHSIEL